MQRPVQADPLPELRRIDAVRYAITFFLIAAGLICDHRTVLIAVISHPRIAPGSVFILHSQLKVQMRGLADLADLQCRAFERSDLLTLRFQSAMIWAAISRMKWFIHC